MSKPKVDIFTLDRLLDYQAELLPHQLAYSFTNDKSRLTYEELAVKVRAIASNLHCLGIREGDRALLIYPQGLEFISVFLGCLYAGVIAVPVAQPNNEKLFHKLNYIIDDSSCNLVLTNDKLKTKIQNHLNLTYPKRKLTCISFEEIEKGDNVSTKLIINPEHLAFLQYTSGSTGQPKGIMVSHKNLLANLNIIYHAFHFDIAGTMISWLPQYHDMGLIGGLLSPLFAGISSLLLSPLQFLQHPNLWLKLISASDEVISGAPDFAYHYCIKKVTEQQKEELDLSRWLVAFNGAEPIQAATLDNFYTAFKSCGLQKNTIFPCYGLAEATLLVSCANRNIGYKTLTVDAELLKDNQIAELKSTDINARTLVSSGIPHQKTLIVNPKTCIPCDEGTIGEIWITSDSVASGYWQKPELSHQVFHATVHGDDSEINYLRTGDLGMLYQGELFITGRLNDLIIIHGRNYYPQDLEHTLGSCHSSVRLGQCAAFSIDVDNEKHLAVVCEITPAREEQEKTYSFLCQIILKAIADDHGLVPHIIALIRPSSLPKTTSGKVRRRYTRDLLLEGGLSLLHYYSLSKENINDISGDTALAGDIKTELYAIFNQTFNYPITDKGFLYAGGDSLIAAQLSAAIKSRWNIHFEPHIFFENITLTQLTALLEDKCCERHRPITPTHSLTHAIPASLGQQQLWFLQQMIPENIFSNLFAVVTLSGKLVVSALEQALSELAQRHEILRTVFHEKQSKIWQVIQPNNKIILKTVDLCRLSSAERETSLKAIITSDSRTPFNLVEGPLICYRLVKLNSQEHNLLITAHHIIMDGWSLKYFLDDLSSLYNSLLDDENPQSLPPLPIQYSDYCLWQHQEAQILSQKKSLSYWKKQLENVPHQLAIFTDKIKRNESPSNNHGNIVFRLEKSLMKQLNCLCNHHQSSLFMILLAAFEIMLCRYSGQNDFVIGTPVANRQLKELKLLIGFFVNILPLRARINNENSFVTHLQSVRQTVLDALAHQDASFEQIVSALKIPRTTQLQPLIQVLFVLQNNDKAKLCFNDLNTQITYGNVESQFDIVLECEIQEERLWCQFAYNANLYERASIERMSVHWMTLLKNIVTHPEALISNLSMLSPEEEQLIVNDFNQTYKEYPQEKTVLQLFEEQASKTPQSIALVLNDTSLTYQALNEKSNQLAYYLRTQKVRANQFIAICLERSFELIISILGILKAGGAYVPLDPDYPDERLHYMLNDTKTMLLITSEKIASRFSTFKNLSCLCIDKGNDVLEQQHTTNLSFTTLPSDLAYVIYTSGSTGLPKGVLINHQGATNLILDLSKRYYIDNGVRVLQLASINFDASFVEIMCSLITGASLYLLPSKEFLLGEKLAEVISYYQIDFLGCTPSILETLNDNANFPKLKTLVLAGETCSQSLLDVWREKAEFVINGYGPTEITVCATTHRYSGTDLSTFIGKPIANKKLYILDPVGEITPIGVAGELYVGGVGVACGYLNHPELTQSCFIPDPFSDQPTARLYKTGDLCRWLSNGVIEYIGRVDNQIKIHGLRIELEEIESHLENHPHIKKAAVVVNKNYTEDKILVAYYTSKTELKLSAHEIKTYLHKKLPSYMIPNCFVEIRDFPLNSNGKMDRKVLAELSISSGNRQTKSPKTVREKQMAKLWKDSLRVNNIGMMDNFFELGGNSFSAAVAINKINELFGVNLPMRYLFTYPTLYEFMNHVKTVKKQPCKPTRETLKLTNKKVDVSFIQEKFLDLYLHAPHKSMAHVPICLKLRGEVDIEKLEAIFKNCIKRHDSFRTSFFITSYPYKQCVQEDVNFKINVISKKISNLDATLQADICRLFNLQIAPLLRVSLYKLAKDDYMLLIVFHHTIIDGWSLFILAEEISALYADKKITRHAEQYLSFSMEQNALFDAEKNDYQNKMLFWKKELAKHSGFMDLPTDFVRPAEIEFSGNKLLFDLSNDTSQSLKEIAHQYQITLSSLLLGIWFLTIYVKFGIESIHISNLIGSRTTVKSQNTLGCFIVNLPIHINVNKFSHQSLILFLKKIHEKSITVQENRDFPLPRLIKDLYPHTPSYLPYEQIEFVFHNDLPQFNLGSIEVSNYVPPYPFTTLDLQLVLWQKNEQIQGYCEYATTLYKSKSIRPLIKIFKNITNQLAKNIELPLETVIEKIR